jgi:hypothetical protein
MDGNISHSYMESIGQTHVDVGHAVYVEKKTERTFWSRVQEALKDARKPVTQVYAARIAGVKQPSVSLWNEPGGFPTIENAIAIAKHVNVCVEWLLTGRGPKGIGPPEEKLARELWQFWPHLDDATKGRIVGIAQENVIHADFGEQEELHRG